MTWQAATEDIQEQVVPDRLQRKVRGSFPASDISNADGVRKPSRFLLRFFDIYLSLYVPFRFNGLRLAFAERFPVDTRPLIVVINHPSWWDPLTSILISRFLMRRADHYAPIDALSLPRHRILGGLGLFPVEQGTPRGAVQFLRAAQRVLADRNAVLWLTPQGGFTDVRVRPVVFKSGLASLIKRLDEVTVLPLAYEYTYWDEPKPEMLACCGEPLRFKRGRAGGEAGGQVAAALGRAQDELAGLASMRDPRLFTTVMAGKGGLRAAGRNVLAALRAQEYRGTVEGSPGRARYPVPPTP